MYAVLTMVSAVYVDQPRWGYSLFSIFMSEGYIFFFSTFRGTLNSVWSSSRMVSYLWEIYFDKFIHKHPTIV